MNQRKIAIELIVKDKENISERYPYVMDKYYSSFYRYEKKYKKSIKLFIRNYKRYKDILYKIIDKYEELQNLQHKIETNYDSRLLKKEDRMIRCFLNVIDKHDIMPDLLKDAIEVNEKYFQDVVNYYEKEIMADKNDIVLPEVDKKEFSSLKEEIDSAIREFVILYDELSKIERIIGKNIKSMGNNCYSMTYMYLNWFGDEEKAREYSGTPQSTIYNKLHFEVWNKFFRNFGRDSETIEFNYITRDLKNCLMGSPFLSEAADESIDKQTTEKFKEEFDTSGKLSQRTKKVIEYVLSRLPAGIYKYVWNIPVVIKEIPALGKYYGATNQIAINERRVLNDSFEYATQVLGHEYFHAYMKNCSYDNQIEEKIKELRETMLFYKSFDEFWEFEIDFLNKWNRNYFDKNEMRRYFDLSDNFTIYDRAIKEELADSLGDLVSGRKPQFPVLWNFIYKYGSQRKIAQHYGLFSLPDDINVEYDSKRKIMRKPEEVGNAGYLKDNLDSGWVFTTPQFKKLENRDFYKDLKFKNINIKKLWDKTKWNLDSAIGTGELSPRGIINLNPDYIKECKKENNWQELFETIMHEFSHKVDIESKIPSNYLPAKSVLDERYMKEKWYQKVKNNWMGASYLGSWSEQRAHALNIYDMFIRGMTEKEIKEIMYKRVGVGLKKSAINAWVDFLIKMIEETDKVVSQRKEANIFNRIFNDFEGFEKEKFVPFEEKFDFSRVKITPGYKRLEKNFPWFNVDKEVKEIKVKIADGIFSPLRISEFGKMIIDKDYQEFLESLNDKEISAILLHEIQHYLEMLTEFSQYMKNDLEIDDPIGLKEEIPLNWERNLKDVEQSALKEELYQYLSLGFSFNLLFSSPS